MKTMKVLLNETRNEFSLKNKIGRFIWNICYILLFRPFSSKIFNPWRLFVLKCFGAKLKGNVLIFSNVKIWAPWNLEMEDACLSKNVICYNMNKVILKTFAVVSQNTHLCTSSHDITSKYHQLISSPIIIEEQAWVAADAFIGMGVTVGEGAVVGARAAVFKNVKPWTVVGGNPAKFIKRREIKN
jgi:putative colanic acid biosynthesis acetyltransferase WcaF